MATDILLVTAFPASQIEAQLKSELLTAIETEASLKGTPLPSDVPGRLIAPVHVDSLVAVEILCTIEPIVGFDLEDSLVRPGGYGSVEETIKVLMPRIEKEWNKRKGAK